MKATLIALATSSLLALGAPAFAQSAGAPGATGSAACGLSGSNTGTCRDQGSNDNYGAGPNGYDRTGPAYMNEGRAAAPDYDNGSGPRDSWRSDAPRPGYGPDAGTDH